MRGWRNWRHCLSGTYGTWLPGDPRGFRTRHHREHVEGDYRNPPPPGKYEQRHDTAKRQLKGAVIVLPTDCRRIALEAMRDAFRQHSVEPIAMAVGGAHVHVLARFPLAERPTFAERGLRTSAVDDPVRHFVGIAKQWSAKRLIRDGWFTKGPIWARRGKIVPIVDRAHQVRVFHYILDHVLEGAAAWSILDEQKARA